MITQSPLAVRAPEGSYAKLLQDLLANPIAESRLEGLRGPRTLLSRG